MRTNGNAVDIVTADGTMDAYAAWPDNGGSYPLVIMFMDIWGLRDELFGLARKVAEQGYYCVLPNLFYRKGKIRYERRNAEGRMVSFDTLPPDLQKEMLALARGLTRQMIETDVAAIFDHVRDKPASDGPAGTVGFCLGGRIGFFAAQSFPDRIHAVSSLHGTLLVTDAPDSTHRLIGRMKGEVYCGHGEHDRASAPEVVAALEAAFKDRDHIAYRGHLHPGAHHGYSMPDRDVHDAEATAIDWRETFAMFARQLKRL
jgi:carboxymethylenebutenolidase